MEFYFGAIQERTSQCVLASLTKLNASSILYVGDKTRVRGWRTEGILWREQGNRLYRKDASEWTKIERIGSLRGSFHEFIPGQGSVFWIVSSQGIARHAPSTWSSSGVGKQVDQIAFSISEDPAGRLWFLHEATLLSWNRGLWSSYPIPADMRGDPLHTGLLAAFKDHVFYPNLV